jgi:nitronate monooxygenase
MDVGARREGSNARPRRDIWGSGQGIGSIHEIVPPAGLIARLRSEYQAARERLVHASGDFAPAA